MDEPQTFWTVWLPKVLSAVLSPPALPYHIAAGMKEYQRGSQ